MSIGAVVLKPRSVPFLAIASAILLLYFVVKAILFGGAIGVFSLVMGALAAAVGLWALWSARRSSVVVDGDQFTVVRRGNSLTYDRSTIVSVDLSGFERHLTMSDGSGVKLPLEGSALVEAGVLLSPHRSRQGATSL